MGVIFFLLFIANLGAQDLSLVHTFPFDKEYFTLVESWDANEGVPGGSALMGFLNNQTAIIGSSNANVLGLFDLGTGRIVQRIPFDSYGVRRFPGRVILGIAATSHTTLLVQSRGASPFVASTLLPKRIYAGMDVPEGPVYLTGKMIFTGIGGVFFSWEKQASGQYLYRDPDATRLWLAENGAQYGYRTDLRVRSVMYLGENSIPERGWRVAFSHLGINHQWIMPQNPKLQTVDLVNGVEYIGLDLKGLAYYFVDNLLAEPGDTGDPTVYSPSRTYIILDPWSMRVVHRTIPGGQYKILQRQHTPVEPYYHLGGYGQQVHPLGDIYLFSANTTIGGFDLMRLRNTWWAELGLDQVQVGQILGNHIPLWAATNPSSEVVAYNYENEYVKVLDESTASLVYDGKPTVWVRVQKVSGAVGWIPKSVIYFEPTE
jgi:hypothetical protein